MIDIKSEEILTYLLLIIVGYYIAKMFSRGCNFKGDGFIEPRKCKYNSGQLCPAKIEGKEILCPSSGICPTQEEVCIKAISNICLEEINENGIINSASCTNCITRNFDRLKDEFCDNDQYGLLSNLRENMCNNPCIGSNMQELPIGPGKNPYAINNCNQLFYFPKEDGGYNECVYEGGDKEPSHAYYKDGDAPGNYNCIKDPNNCEDIIDPICKCKKGNSCFDWYDV